MSFRNLVNMKKVYLLCLVALVFSACTKKPDPVTEVKPEPSTGFVLEFDNSVNNESLVFGKYYLNENGDSFRVSAFKYYISNISLTGSNGEMYTEESYHLINHANDSSKSFVLKNVADGKYVKLRFMIGVDSIRNISGAQVGALDPANAMFWDWNTGYVMAKVEGYSPQASIYPNNLALHIGGYAQPYSALRWVTLTLPTVAYSKSEKRTIHIKANLAEWFKTPNLIKFADFSTVAKVGADAQKIADNYADMFTIDHID